MLFGMLNLLSVIYLTGVVALVLGTHECEATKGVKHPVMSYWLKLLGGLGAAGLVVYVLSLLGRWF